MSNPNEFISPEQPVQEVVVHRNDDELRGRFADTFGVLYNGDNFAIEFFTKMPRQDGKFEQVLVSRIFLTEKGVTVLANSITNVVNQIKAKGLKQIPPAQS